MKQKVAGGEGGGVHINHKKDNSKASYIAKIKVYLFLALKTLKNTKRTSYN